MKTAKNFRLPTTPEQGKAGLLAMADTFGDQDMFLFLGLMHGNDSPVGEVRAVLAIRLVMAHMRKHPDLTYTQARLDVAKTLGYQGTHLSNWHRSANRGRDALLARGEWPADLSVAQ